MNYSLNSEIDVEYKIYGLLEFYKLCTLDILLDALADHDVTMVTRVINNLIRNDSILLLTNGAVEKGANYASAIL
jgi:hypothetical protein